MEIFSKSYDNIFNKFEPKFIGVAGYKINVEVLGEGKLIVVLTGGPGNYYDNV